MIKPKHSAFYGTALNTLLQQLNVDTLILTGIAGNICVLFTANDAYMREYNFMIPEDCIASNNDKDNKYALTMMKNVLTAETKPVKELRIITYCIFLLHKMVVALLCQGGKKMQIHVVKVTDHYRRLPRSYGSSVQDIVEANELPNPNNLVVGQAMVIPIVGSFYWVQPGDSLWSISRKFGVSYQELARINGISVNQPLSSWLSSLYSAAAKNKS